MKSTAGAGRFIIHLSSFLPESSMLPYALGIDLGATNVKGLVVAPNGTVLRRESISTHGPGETDWQAAVRQVYRRLHAPAARRPESIGLAAPGLAAPDRRSVLALPERLKGIEGLVWQEFFQVSHPVPVLNDAHAALLGEGWQGAAQGAENVVLVTLGTGVGGAVKCDGRLLRGHLGRAGHLGHIALDPEGAPDITRTPGSLEDAIGECTLPQRSGGQFHTTRELLTAGEQGDAVARAVWQRSVQALAAALASFINLFDPEKIVIGGGIAQAGPALFAPLEAFLRRFEWQVNGFTVPVVPAALGEWAGALGAAWQAQHADVGSPD